MTKIDLITGFLGAGKTTFLKGYVSYFLKKGERICLLEFDYGAVNVDMMLLQEFNQTCDIEMVAGGCDRDCFLRRFRTKLIAMGMRHYDRVIIEPSGIFEPDALFDDLREEPLEQWYEMGSSIMIVDPFLRAPLSKQSEYFLVAQLSSAGCLVISKIELATDKEVDDVITLLNDVASKHHLHLPSLITKIPFSQLLDEGYEQISASSYHQQSYIHENMEDAYQSISILNPKLDAESIKILIPSLFSSKEVGVVFRVKGFYQEERKWFEFNATKNKITIQEIPTGQDVILVIGEQIHESAIKMLLHEAKTH